MTDLRQALSMLRECGKRSKRLAEERNEAVALLRDLRKLESDRKRGRLTREEWERRTGSVDAFLSRVDGARKPNLGGGITEDDVEPMDGAK